jgi:hypothetical protein
MTRMRVERPNVISFNSIAAAEFEISLPANALNWKQIYGTSREPKELA